VGDGGRLVAVGAGSVGETAIEGSGVTEATGTTGVEVGGRCTAPAARVKAAAVGRNSVGSAVEILGGSRLAQPVSNTTITRRERMGRNDAMMGDPFDFTAVLSARRFSDQFHS
jgi:hypothetical protein